jgi:hypothetical protein
MARTATKQKAATISSHSVPAADARPKSQRWNASL